MPDADTYLTLAAPGEAEFKDRGSRFLAEAVPVADEAAAEAHVEAARKRDYDATHHCTAYRLGSDGATWRYNDDGEPSGTAGAPILRQIEARELTDVLVVVVRYYGGTKLGTGGLLRAYGDAASMALDAAPTREVVLRTRVILRFAYDDTSPALHAVDQVDAEVVDRRYSDVTELVLAVRRSDVERLEALFTEGLSGRGEAVVG